MKKNILIGMFVLIVAVGSIFAFVVLKKGSRTSDNQEIIENANSTQGVVITPTSTVVEPVVDQFPHDKDQDGIENSQEEKLGLSDTDFDSDLDGLSDFKEVNVFKTDPKKKDTDGDSYADGYEVFNGFNPGGSGTLESSESGE